MIERCRARLALGWGDRLGSPQDAVSFAAPDDVGAVPDFCFGRRGCEKSGHGAPCLLRLGFGVSFCACKPQNRDRSELLIRVRARGWPRPTTARDLSRKTAATNHGSGFVAKDGRDQLRLGPCRERRPRPRPLRLGTCRTSDHVGVDVRRSDHRERYFADGHTASNAPDLF